ncbi:gamma-glutamyltransferase [Nocardioides sp. W7]|uniref:gamma-glutamyltransferase n=1 Tax=Nocardioides sp. W7 TaxID=2931390 RepID=UPI001FD2725F|nr:gamma-glutamyltransferase [Nocardioides sp. W7]
MHLRRVPAVLLALALPAATLAVSSAAPAGAAPPKKPTARGSGGAVSSVDPYATRVGLRVLKAGGNAVDAAVATAAALGVTEPYSAGIGGGGYFVVYDAKSGRVRTIDGRETAPKAMPRDAFINPTTGDPYTFTPDLVTSGVSVGVPGTPATWQRALDRWGTWSLAETLAPATRIARKGFRVDRTFRQQTLDNEVRFNAFRSTKRLFLRGGDAPRIGSTFRNRDLAETYRLLARRGTDAFYEGALARQIARTVRKPPKTRDTTLPVPRGYLTARDLKRYRTVDGRATKVAYRGYQVHGMPPSSSGGSTVGEALNILEGTDLGELARPAALHHYLEASALAFADRGKYVGDPRFTKVPIRHLLSQKYARERACAIDPARAMAKPTAAGDVRSYDGKCAAAPRTAASAEDTENVSTTNLTVVDKWGNVVEYTLTIEQTGGSGIVVPGRGFLLNNELTDFSTEYVADDPNRIQPGKRPRSSMSPTIVTKRGKPVLALGSPGGSTIITTVLQMLVNRLDLGMSLPQAIAAPRAAQRNTANVTAEPAFLQRYGDALTAYGHTLVPAGDAFTSAAEIGAATAIGIRGRRLIAVAEPVRRGGGAAGVVKPRK